MVIHSFLGLPNNLLVSAQTIQKQKNRSETNNKNKPFYWLLFFLVLISVGIYVANELHRDTPEAETNIDRFERLVQKIQSGEMLSKDEQSEFCQLLPSVKGFTIDNCENLDLSNLKSLLKFIEAINSVEPNRVHHILQEHHHWQQLFDKPTWENVKQIVLRTLMQGGKTSYKLVWKKVLIIDNHVIEVVFFEDDEFFSITDAWVKN